ncbi:MAG: ferrous iron transport protein B [Victivallales bacterium]|jgi:ferrous iron transport protein B|nr:ferrous iron transport protein B [Victivallales bacterium]
MESHIFRIALAGNPNCGKTTIFNSLTGTRQHVGNYPGVTVERKTGICRIGEFKAEIIDLPGIYSLSSSSPEEKVAFQELLNGKIDLILNVVDASNAQRNMYLTAQLTELDIPMLLAFNMIDDAAKQGLSFDFEKLESFFGSPIVPTIGFSGEGIDELKSAIKQIALERIPQHPVKPKYGPKTDEAIRALTAGISELNLPETKRIPARYFAIKILEDDPEICLRPDFEPFCAEAAVWRDQISARNGISSRVLMADVRYGVIAGACREAITVNNERRRQLSDVIDKFVTNRFLGVPIFLFMMYLVFQFTFTLGQYPMDYLEMFFGWLGDFVTGIWPEGQGEFLKRLIVEGVIGGVGGVLVFLPNILFLFLAIAILEGTGYMARAAFVMDGFMHKFGLHGKSFIPMLLGFGCSVPAIMAARTIDNESDRKTTMMVVPFISCGARLPIYSMLIPAFFAIKYQALTMWILYVLGIVVALGCALALKSTIFRGEGEVFVMELPPYRWPTLRSIFILMWEKTSLYLQKAGTLILLASVVLFVINTFPEKTEFSRNYADEIATVQKSALSEEEQYEKISILNAEQKSEELEYSIAGRIGKKLEIVMKPIGFDWKVSSALIGAFAAKELFVAQLGILYSVEDFEAQEDSLQSALQKTYTPLQGFCIMVFCLLTIPCVATMAVVKRESNSWKFMLGQIALFTVIAYIVTLAVFQVGSLLEIGTKVVVPESTQVTAVNKDSDKL